MSAAARLAKLRHDVTLVESGSRLGGRLRGVEIDGQAWPLDVETVTLPGVFRDLFRKSGRPLERSLEMSLTSERRHLFRDKTVLDLPFGDRALQHDAMRAVLKPEFRLRSPARRRVVGLDRRLARTLGRAASHDAGPNPERSGRSGSRGAADPRCPSVDRTSG